MKASTLIYVSACWLTLFGCAKDDKKSDKKKEGATSDQTQKDQTDNGNTDDSTTDTTVSDFIYTGYDGSTDYSLLVPGFREIVATDTSVVKIEIKKTKMSDAVVEELIAEAKKDNPDFDETRFKRFFGREQTSYLITPLKAGETVLKLKPRENNGNGSNWKPGEGKPGGGKPGGGRFNKGGFGGTKWSKDGVKIIITGYNAEQLAAGKKRYTTDGGGGNLRACKSCHANRGEGAPPHELGRISEISDADAKKWVTTGEAEGRKAKIKHTWEFSSDEEEEGIVAYLRSLQTNDSETLTKLYVEQAILDGGFSKPADDASSPAPSPAP